MEGPIDMSSITFEDLQEEYQKLRERYAQLIVINEKDTQRIHDLRRNLETATAAEIYLAQELEQLSSMQTSQDDALLSRKQSEVDEMKKRQGMLLTENEEMHQDLADLRVENEKLNRKIKDLTVASIPVEIVHQIPREHIDVREKLEADNLELLAKLDETHENIVKFTISLAEKEKHIEILKDQVLCLDENLQSKREEVEEKSHLLESAQEQVIEMNAKIAMLTSCPDNVDRKGNSLFAEVDDQRQAMKQLLAAQKKSYEQMKKIFNESQHEIRRLKRENVAMHNELHTCSAIFCSADKVYKEKLNERILQLLKQNEDLEKKLMVTQQELISLANDKGVVWLDSMLLFCKHETDELKKQLHSNRIHMGILEERLRNSQQSLAKWRFEALKTRCVLLDRESLLTDNKIKFKMFTNNDVAFSSDELESAKPNLGFVEQSEHKHISEPEPLSKETPQISVIEIEDDEDELVDDKQILVTISESTIKGKLETPQVLETVAIKIENSSEQTNNITIECHQKPETSPICKAKQNEIKAEPANSIELELSRLRIKTELDENKENICVPHSETVSTEKICAKESSLRNFNTNTEFAQDLSPRQSILVTKRSVLDDGTNKTVQFAKTVDSSEPKSFCKSIRTKSNVIVRRILVHSKTKSEPGAPPIP